MTAEQKNIVSTLKDQATPVLLAIIGFFLVQTNNKIDTAIIKIDQYAVNQAAQEAKIEAQRERIIKLEDQIAVMQSNIADFYEQYGYLFTPETRQKLTR